MNFIRKHIFSSITNIIHGPKQPLLPTSSAASVPVRNALNLIPQISPLQMWCRSMATLDWMLRHGPHIKKRPNRNPLGPGKPFAKGVVLKTLIKKPKKPNSANRKCVLVRLSTGKEMTAYVPGIGHNLQEHSVVLVRVGRLKDVPGVKIKCVRGKYDLGHVIKPTPT